MLIAFNLLLLDLQTSLPDTLTILAFVLALLSAVLYMLVPPASSTKESAMHDSQPQEAVSPTLSVSEDRSPQFKTPTRQSEPLKTRHLQDLKRALQEGNLEKAVEYIVHAHSQAGLSWEPILSTMAQIVPRSVMNVDDVEELAARAFEQLQEFRDMKACLNALLAYRWLALVSPDNTPDLTTYWYHQGLAYSYLPEDSDQTTIFAAITCFQVASTRCKKRRDRELHAEIQCRLGLAYTRLTRGDDETNRRAAIAYFSTALQYYKYWNRSPQRRAYVHYQLARLYKDLLVIRQEPASAITTSELHHLKARKIWRKMHDPVVDDVGLVLQDIKNELQH